MPGIARILAGVLVLAFIPQVPIDASPGPPRALVLNASSARAALALAAPAMVPSTGECTVSPGVVESEGVVTGTLGSDSIDCSRASAGKVIDALAGDDSIVGSEHGDRVRAGAGDDLLAGGPGADELHGGPGIDTATFAPATAGVAVDLEGGTARGEGRDRLISIPNIIGSSHDDTLRGSQRANLLHGGGGHDVLNGFGGNDDIRGGRGHDTLAGGDGRDQLDGGEAKDACASGTGRGSRRRCEALPFAEAASVILFEPSETVIGVGFHESMFGIAYELSAQGDGPLSVVLGSRGRGTAATSAADVVVESSSSVLSPVTGTVVAMIRYYLYCKALDWELVIRPDDNPDVSVIMLHFVAPEVRAGDRVLASVTPVGTSWTNDSPSAQENQAFPDQYPHIHVEIVEEGDPPIAGCSS